MHISLTDMAGKLPSPWSSTVVGTASGVNIKVLRMDERPLEAEAHDYAEALIVLDGCMRLSVAGEPLDVGSGEMVVVPAGVEHAIVAGSYGTLLIIDPPLPA